MANATFRQIGKIVSEQVKSFETVVLMNSELLEILPQLKIEANETIGGYIDDSLLEIETLTSALEFLSLCFSDIQDRITNLANSLSQNHWSSSPEAGIVFYLFESSLRQLRLRQISRFVGRNFSANSETENPFSLPPPSGLLKRKDKKGGGNALKDGGDGGNSSLTSSSSASSLSSASSSSSSLTRTPEVFRSNPHMRVSTDGCEKGKNLCDSDNPQRLSARKTASLSKKNWSSSQNILSSRNFERLSPKKSNTPSKMKPEIGRKTTSVRDIGSDSDERKSESGDETDSRATTPTLSSTIPTSFQIGEISEPLPSIDTDYSFASPDPFRKRRKNSQPKIGSQQHHQQQQEDSRSFMKHHIWANFRESSNVDLRSFEIFGKGGSSSHRETFALRKEQEKKKESDGRKLSPLALRRHHHDSAPRSEKKHASPVVEHSKSRDFAQPNLLGSLTKSKGRKALKSTFLGSPKHMRQASPKKWQTRTATMPPSLPLSLPEENGIFEEREEEERKMMTIEEILEELTREKSGVRAERKLFLKTYSRFTSADVILQLLCARYRDHSENHSKEEMVAIRSAIVTLVKTWIDFEAEDLSHHQPALFELFDAIGVSHPSTSSTLLSLFNIKKEKKFGEKKYEVENLLPLSIQGNFDQEELALAITFREFELYSEIKVQQLLHWNSKNRNCPDIERAIEFSNQISGWVTCELVRCVKLNERSRLFEKFISLGESLLMLKNFSSCKAVLAGLLNSAVWRMKKTRANLDSCTIACFDKLKSMMSHSSNYASYRAYLKGTSPPCVPYLGVFLSDLTFIDDGNVDSDDSKINFYKWKMMANVVGNFLNCLSSSYYESYSRPLVDFEKALHSYPFLDEEELFQYSSFSEPTEETMEKMLGLYKETQDELSELKLKLQSYENPSK